MAVVVNHAFFLKNTTQETLNDNFYIKFSNFISLKSHQYYLAFKKVITAQMIISAINTFLSFFILFALGFPFKIALLLLIFMAGLIPVLGNLVSNTVICAVAFIYLGIPEVIISLIFLLVIHKLEYLLNSKIIGNKIDIPMYQILLTIILGEAILGINGIIIAVPTLLFIKEQFKKIS
jgi:predicted PurR-regulated permease PerM